MKKVLALVLALALALSLSAVVFADTNLALSGTIIVDSVNAQFGGDPENANDGDYTTRWQSNATGNSEDDAGWIGVELDDEYAIGTIVIEWETAHPATDGFRVEISDDGENWTATNFTAERVETQEGDDAKDHQVDTITLTDVPTTQYVRVVCFSAFVTGGNVKENPSAYEFEVYEGTPGEGGQGGVESVMMWAVLFVLAAAAVVFTAKKVRA